MFNHRVGDYGLAALLLTLLLISISGGVSLLCSLVWTLVVAGRLPFSVASAEAYVVPSKQLLNDLPDEDFLQRLERVKQLWHLFPAPVYALGGCTGNNSRSEASVAADILLAGGIDKQAVSL